MESYTYTPVTKESLIKDINKTKFLNIEQFIFMFRNFLESYRDGVIAFGYDNEFNKNLKNKMKEYRKILKQEKVFFNYILANIDNFNLDAVDRLLDEFDVINDKTLTYYDDYFDRASYAAYRNDPDLLYSCRHDETLLETEKYAKQVAGLSINEKYLREYLGYEDHFWNFIQDTTKRIETTPEIAEQMSYVTPIYDKDGYVSMIKLFVPKVVDLDTALIALKTYSKAYEYYMNYMLIYYNRDNQCKPSEFISTIDISKLKLK